MRLTHTNRLVWLITTIRKAGKITFAELNDKWRDNEDMSEGKELSHRTFFKWKDDCMTRFNVDIVNENCGEYRYYLRNAGKLTNGSVEKWLFDTNAVSNQLIENQSVSDRIILEDIPSGQAYLQDIIDAMKENHLIHITYYNYWRGDERQHYVMPLCVKLFRQRWYLIAKQWQAGYITTYCLDRIVDFRMGSHTFEYPKDFSPKKFFKNLFGVIAEEGTPPTIKLKVTAGQANYIRDLPLHPSQEEIERGDEYSIFTLKVHPTFDLEQEILWNGEDIEVLEPLELRNRMTDRIELMYNKYKEDK